MGKLRYLFCFLTVSAVLWICCRWCMPAALVRFPEFFEPFWIVPGRICKKQVFSNRWSLRALDGGREDPSEIHNIVDTGRRNYFNYINNCHIIIHKLIIHHVISSNLVFCRFPLRSYNSIHYSRLSAVFTLSFWPTASFQLGWRHVITVSKPGSQHWLGVIEFHP